MRKVSSAPSLHELGRKNSEQPAGSRVAKQTCPSLMPGTRRKEALQQESKARNVSTGSLPLLLEPPPITVPRLRELEQFAESSKGLAGLDCYEKFSQQQKPAPEAREPDESDLVGRARIAEEVQQDEEDQAKAACLATPYTADERNLGEQVEAAARERLQAVEEDLNGRFRETVELPRRETRRVQEEVAPPRTLRRKRRFLDSFGFKKHAKEGSNKFVFQDNGLAESYLATQASLQDETNRMSLPQSWACNEDICHPVDNFRTELIRPEENFYGRWSGEQSGLQRAQSIQY